MADTKLTALTADASPTTDDLIYTVTDPAGTPASRKVTISALKTLITPTITVLHPEGSMPPATAYATFDTRAGGSTPAESVSVLDFDDTTAEYMDWKVRMPDSYNGGGLSLSIEWSATSATANKVVWQAAIRRFADDAEDVDTSQTYDYNVHASGTTTASASGETVKSTITFTAGADMDSWAAGETAIVRIGRLPTDGNDTMVGDAELWNVYIKET